MPANLQFKRGLLANMPSNIVDGTIYVTTDEHAMYMDYGNQRIRLGDFIPVATINDLPQAGHAYETAVYYVRSGNILARWDTTNSRWVQINKAGVVGVYQTNQGGNVITDITTTVSDDGQLRLAITKATVATSEDLADLTRRVGNLETSVSGINNYITILQGDQETPGSLANLAATVEAALLGNEVQYTTLEEAANAIRALQGRVTSVETDLSSLSTSVNSLSGTVASHTTSLATLTGDASTPGSVAAQVAAEATARTNADTALSGRLDSAETNITSLTRRVGNAEDAIDVLNGDAQTTGSVAKQVNDAIAEVVANAPDDFDTLREISDWISNHADSAATMNSNITSLQTDVGALQQSVNGLNGDLEALEARVETAEDDIDALESDVNTLTGDVNTPDSVAYQIHQATSTLDADLTALTRRVGTAEGAIETLNGDATTTGSVAKAVADEAALRTAADTALGNRIDTLSNSVSTNTNNISSLQTDVSALTTKVNDHEDRLTWIEY